MRSERVRQEKVDYTKDPRFVRFDVDTCYLRTASGKEIAIAVDTELTSAQTDELKQKIRSGKKVSIPLTVRYPYPPSVSFIEDVSLKRLARRIFYLVYSQK